MKNRILFSVFALVAVTLFAQGKQKDFVLSLIHICTWDSIKLWDPGQASANGAAYPIQRTYSMQLSLNF